MKRETERRKEEREREREYVPEPAPSNQINFYPKRKLSPYLPWNGPKRKTIGVTDEMDCMGSFYLSWNSHRFRDIYIYIFPFSVIGKTCEIGLWSWVVFFGVLAAKLSRIALFVIHAFAFNWSLTPTEVFLKETLRCM